MLKNQGGAVTIIITIIILSAILLTSIVMTNLILQGTEAERLSHYSYNSYYASESGVEREIYYLVQMNYTPVTGDVFNFTLANGASYTIKITQTSPMVIFKSIGEYKGTQRALEINY